MRGVHAGSAFRVMIMSSELCTAQPRPRGEVRRRFSAISALRGYNGVRGEREFVPRRGVSHEISSVTSAVDRVRCAVSSSPKSLGSARSRRRCDRKRVSYQLPCPHCFAFRDSTMTLPSSRHATIVEISCVIDGRRSQARQRWTWWRAPASSGIARRIF